MSVVARDLETPETALEHLRAAHGYGSDPGQLKEPRDPLTQHAREHALLECDHTHLWLLLL